MFLDGDVTVNWDTTTGTNHFGEIDEGTVLGGTPTPSDADYIETTTINDDDEFTFDASPANVSQVTTINLNIRGYITDVSTTARYKVDLTHSAGTPVTGSPKYVTGTNLGGYGTTVGEFASSFTGLTLTKTQVDSLQTKITFLET